MRQETLRMIHVSKTDEGREVLGDINLTVGKGEIVGVVGLQDTGKAVLADILGGHCVAESGGFWIDGVRANFDTPLKAQLAGVHTVSWQPQLVGGMTIAMNIFLLNAKNARRQIFSPKRVVAEAVALMDHYNVGIPPGKPVEGLSQTQVRTVELLRIAAQSPKLVILRDILEDNVLTGGTFERVMRQMLEEGVSFLVLSNKLSAVVGMCDKIYLLREGVLTSELPKSRLDSGTLLEMMLGGGRPLLRPPNAEESGPPPPGTRPVLELIDATSGECIFSLRPGEILGLVPEDVHNYVDYLVQFLAGSRAHSRLVLKNGKPLRVRGVRNLVENRIVVIPNHIDVEDVFLRRPLADNFALTLDASTAGAFGFVNARKCRYLARKVAQLLEIDASHVERALRAGRVPREAQQRLRIGRWIWHAPAAYIFLNPFADTDEKGSDDLIRILRLLAGRGCGVLVVSANYYKLDSVCSGIIRI